jgi:membrane protease YdiL (CAAX protease family)
VSAALRSYLIVIVTVVALAVGIGLRFRTSIWQSTTLACALPLFLIACWYRPQFGRLLPRSTREAALGVGSALAMAVLTWSIYPVAARFVPGLDAQVRELYGEITEWPGRLNALPLLAVIVVVEECVFRGVLMDELLRGRPRAAGVAWAAAIYTLPQLASGSWVLVSLAAVCGTIWSAQRARTASLAIPFITHLIWDALVFVLWPVR